MPGNPLVRFDEGRVGRTARCRPLSYSTDEVVLKPTRSVRRPTALSAVSALVLPFALSASKSPSRTSPTLPPQTSSRRLWYTRPSLADLVN